MSRLRFWARLSLVGASVAVVLALAGCLMSRGSGSGEDRFVRPGAPRNSPSGSFTASVVPGPDQDGVATTIVVISDATGKEVFRDNYAYSNRHGVGVTWLSTQDQLWILSSDVGSAHVDRTDAGWTKTMVTPETKASVPEEITRLGG
jgi:hypothetical protein